MEEGRKASCLPQWTMGLTTQAAFKMPFPFRAVRGPSGEGWLNAWCLLHITEYYMAIKKERGAA